MNLNKKKGIQQVLEGERRNDVIRISKKLKGQLKRERGQVEIKGPFSSGKLHFCAATAHKLLSSLHSTLMYLKPLLVPICLLTTNKEIILYLQSFDPKCKISKSRKTGSFWSSDVGSLNTSAKMSVAEFTHPSQIYKLLSELYEETWVAWEKSPSLHRRRAPRHRSFVSFVCQGRDSYFILFLLILDKVLLCSQGWPRNHNSSPASPTQVVGLKACSTTSRLFLWFFWDKISVAQAGFKCCLGLP